MNEFVNRDGVGGVILNLRAKRDAEREENRTCDDVHDNPT